MAKKMVQPDTNGMFTREHYQMLINERRNLNDMIATLDKAQQCGVDCAMYRQMRQDIDSQLSAIQQHFMSPPPN
jgi:hypothetical protein